MEVEPQGQQQEVIEGKQLDPRPEVDILLTRLEETRERDEEVSSLLDDVVTFMKENPEERFALWRDVPEGRLITEGEELPEVYVLLESATLPVASKSFEVGDTTQEVVMGTVRLPTVIGEISKLLDGKATANVDLTSPTTLITLSGNQLTRMSNSGSFKKHHVDLANERLERQLDMMERIDTILGHRGGDVKERESLTQTLALDTALAEALAHGSTTRVFELTGTHRTTGEHKTQGFIASFTRRESGNVTVDIAGAERDSNIIIPLKIRDGGRYIAVERKIVNMGSSAEYGFYSKILGAFLEKASVFESETTEPRAMNVIDQYPSGETVPTSTLAAASPIFAARKGFISYVRGKEQKVTSYRVDARLARILRLATDAERGKLEERYQVPTKDALRILQRLTEQYMASEAPKMLPKEASEALEAQYHRIQELCNPVS